MKEKNLPWTVLFPVMLSLLSAVIIAAVLLTAFTGIAYSTGDPDSLVTPLSTAALALSALVCGIVSARLCDRELLLPILSSVISGVGYVILLFLLSVIPAASGAAYTTGIKTVMYLGVVGVSALGGVVGNPRGKRRPKYPRRMKRR